MIERDPTDFVAAGQARDAARASSTAKAKEFAEDLGWLMNSVRGRRLAFWLLSQAGVYRTTFFETPQRAPYMALAMAHDEGRKELGYRLMGEIGRVCPESYAQMMKENSNV